MSRTTRKRPACRPVREFSEPKCYSDTPENHRARSESGVHETGGIPTGFLGAETANTKSDWYTLVHTASASHKEEGKGGHLVSGRRRRGPTRSSAPSSIRPRPRIECSRSRALLVLLRTKVTERKRARPVSMVSRESTRSLIKGGYRLLSEGGPQAHR